MKYLLPLLIKVNLILTKYKLIGPTPLQGSDGHEMCIEYYQTVATEEEWIDRAAATSDMDDPSNVLIFVGGYNCRH